MIPLHIPESAELVGFSYYNYYRENEDAYLEIRFSSVEDLQAYLVEYMVNAENYLRQYTPPTTGEWFLTVPNPYHSAYTDLVSCHATVHSGGEIYTGYYVEPLGEEGLPWLLANCWIVSFSEEELCVIHSRFRGSFFENEDRYTPKYLRRFQVAVELSLDRRYFLSGEALDSEGEGSTA